MVQNTLVDAVDGGDELAFFEDNTNTVAFQMAPEFAENTERRKTTIAPNILAQLAEENKSPDRRPSVFPRMSLKSVTVDAEVQTDSEPLKQF